MAIERRFSQNHPDRAAIGVCVITKMPICGECSTRYEGVNYSREGMRILQERRKAAAGPKKVRTVYVLLWLIAPVMIWLVYLYYYGTFEGIMKLLHRGL